MPDQKAHELLRKHNINLNDVMERRTTLIIWAGEATRR